MAFRVQCNICGFINYSDDHSYPLCAQCHAVLASCSHCKRYDEGKCKLSLPVIGDGVLLNECKKFAPKKVSGSDNVSNFAPYIWFTCMIALIIFGAVYGAMSFNKDYRFSSRANFSVTATFPDTISKEHEAKIYLTIINEGKSVSPRVFLSIPYAVINSFAYYDFNPTPEQMYFEKNGDLLVVYNEIDVDGLLEVEINFLPAYNINIDFISTIYSPIGRRQAVVQSMLYMQKRN